MTRVHPPPLDLSRRRLLGKGATASAALGLTGLGLWGLQAPAVHAAKTLQPVKLAWNANAPCLAAAPVAQAKGIFARHGLEVELINFSGSTDQLLEVIATSKADAGLGMIHRWIKPLESGFDVKLVGSSHGGCSRLVGYEKAGVKTLAALKGKTIAQSPGWREDDLICKPAEQAQQADAPRPAPAQGLDALIARMDAAPLSPLRAGFLHR